MKNEFVPYNIALAMKELGFNESCFGYYLLEDECFMDVRIRRQGEALCLAPLYQQAFRWFREKYNIHSNIIYPNDESMYINSPLFRIEVLEKIPQTLFKRYKTDWAFNSYEEAQDACLRKLIEIVKEKQR